MCYHSFVWMWPGLSVETLLNSRHFFLFRPVIYGILWTSFLHSARDLKVLEKVYRSGKNRDIFQHKGYSVVPLKTLDLKPYQVFISFSPFPWIFTMVWKYRTKIEHNDRWRLKMVGLLWRNTTPLMPASFSAELVGVKAIRPSLPHHQK